MAFVAKIKSIIKYAQNRFKPTPKVCPKISLLASNELLKGRVALITGVTSGIGFEIAKSFIRSGAKVVITGRNKERLEKAVDTLHNEFNDKSCAYGIVMDITNVKQFNAKFEEAVKLVDRPIDILVNNAGVNGCAFVNGNEEDYDLVQNTNLRGPFFLSQVFSHYMIDNKIKGNILNIASSSSLRPAVSAYGLSKWGIVGLTQGLARLLTRYGIVVNGIAPGPTATPMQGVGNGEDVSLPSNLTGRYALPEEIGNMAVILVSDMSRQIVGDIIYMTGGSGLIYNGDINYSFTN